MPSEAKIRVHASWRFLPAMTCSFLLGVTLACARQEPLHSESENSSSEQTLPFHPDSRPAESDDGSPAIPPDLRSGRAPFRAGHSDILPAGTLLTVRMRTSLSAEKVHEGDAFAATLAAPLMIGGKAVADSGSIVSGHIEAARQETDRTQPLGYFRLTLDQIVLDGVTLPIHTSSLFARGTVAHFGDAEFPTVRIRKGRRLTFRLIASVPLRPDDPTLQVSRQHPSSPAE
jgi:hypothetical protein